MDAHPRIEPEQPNMVWRAVQVMSFDEYGVSGHANHRAIHAALKQMMREALGRPGTDTTSIPVWQLVRALNPPTSAITTFDWICWCHGGTPRHMCLIEYVCDS